MTRKRARIFRCYRCGELRNGKPRLTIGSDLFLCKQCYDESQGRTPSAVNE